MAETKKTDKKIAVGAVALAVAAVVMAGLFLLFREKPTEGSKQITITVVNSRKEDTDYTLRTDAKYLRQAMEEADGLTFSGQESEYGMMVETVNGETVDFDRDGSYWAFYVNGEYCSYGIDTQPVEDEDVFRIEYTVSAASE